MEADAITSVELSSDGKNLLTSVSSHEIHLWDLNTKQLRQVYKGLKQARYVIRSSFGGYNENFVISGSEDSQIYIWHRKSGNLLFTLEGHSGTVNTVSWNKVHHNLFASCSDDHTAKIWTTSDELNNWKI